MSEEYFWILEPNFDLSSDLRIETVTSSGVFKRRNPKLSELKRHDFEFKVEEIRKGQSIDDIKTVIDLQQVKRDISTQNIKWGRLNDRWKSILNLNQKMYRHQIEKADSNLQFEILLPYCDECATIFLEFYRNPKHKQMIVNILGHWYAEGDFPIERKNRKKWFIYYSTTFDSEYKALLSKINVDDLKLFREILDHSKVKFNTKLLRKNLRTVANPQRVLVSWEIEIPSWKWFQFIRTLQKWKTEIEIDANERKIAVGDSLTPLGKFYLFQNPIANADLYLELLGLTWMSFGYLFTEMSPKDHFVFVPGRILYEKLDLFSLPPLSETLDTKTFVPIEFNWTNYKKHIPDTIKKLIFLSPYIWNISWHFLVTIDFTVNPFQVLIYKDYNIPLTHIQEVILDFCKKNISIPWNWGDVDLHIQAPFQTEVMYFTSISPNLNPNDKAKILWGYLLLMYACSWKIPLHERELDMNLIFEGNTNVNLPEILTEIRVFTEPAAFTWIRVLHHLILRNSLQFPEEYPAEEEKQPIQEPLEEFEQPLQEESVIREQKEKEKQKELKSPNLERSLIDKLRSYVEELVERVKPKQINLSFVLRSPTNFESKIKLLKAQPETEQTKARLDVLYSELTWASLKFVEIIKCKQESYGMTLQNTSGDYVNMKIQPVFNRELPCTSVAAESYILARWKTIAREFTIQSLLATHTDFVRRSFGLGISRLHKWPPFANNTIKYQRQEVCGHIKNSIFDTPLGDPIKWHFVWAEQWNPLNPLDGYSYERYESKQMSKKQKKEKALSLLTNVYVQILASLVTFESAQVIHNNLLLNNIFVEETKTESDISTPLLTIKLSRTVRTPTSTKKVLTIMTRTIPTRKERYSWTYTIPNLNLRVSISDFEQAVQFLPLSDPYREQMFSEDLLYQQHEKLSYPIANWFELDNSRKPVKNFDIWTYARLFIFDYFRVETGKSLNLLSMIEEMYEKNLQETKGSEWIEILRKMDPYPKSLAKKLFLHTILIAFFNLEANQRKGKEREQKRLGVIPRQDALRKRLFQPIFTKTLLQGKTITEWKGSSKITILNRNEELLSLLDNKDYQKFLLDSSTDYFASLRTAVDASSHLSKETGFWDFMARCFSWTDTTDSLASVLIVHPFIRKHGKFHSAVPRKTRIPKTPEQIEKEKKRKEKKQKRQEKTQKGTKITITKQQKT